MLGQLASSGLVGVHTFEQLPKLSCLKNDHVALPDNSPTRVLNEKRIMNENGLIKMEDWTE